jgi:transcription-repair coupling factor (superfamily II helicase)
MRIHRIKINAGSKSRYGDRPMDRLVCGDVGFGKTEVAIRAAFKAVDGKQVAILVPTTILAYQHYRTFTERLKICQLLFI